MAVSGSIFSFSKPKRLELEHYVYSALVIAALLPILLEIFNAIVERINK
jgi:hypothetical protein